MICNPLRIDGRTRTRTTSVLLISHQVFQQTQNTCSPVDWLGGKSSKYRKPNHCISTKDPGRCKKEHMTLLTSPAGIDWSIYSILLNKDID